MSSEPQNPQPQNQQPQGNYQAPYGQQPGAQRNLPFGIPPEMVRPSVGFKQAFRLWSKNMFTFKGRAGQSEFWWVYGTFALIFYLSFFTLYIFFFVSTFAALEQTGGSSEMPPSLVAMLILFIAYGLITLAGTLTTLALGWRRLQDAGFPGALWLLNFIGLGMVPFILAFFHSSPNGLQYENRALKS